MKVTAELSLYPLEADFEDCIISFIQHLKKFDKIEVLTHSMSSYVKGESKDVFRAIDAALEAVNDKTDTLSLVIKIINRDLPVEQGFLNF